MYRIRRLFSVSISSIILTLVSSVSALAETDSMPSTEILKSPKGGVQLVELYTSQGCYSCPPAERWMNKMVDSPDLWTRLIPINLHVDYWDYIGWKDPFARAEFSSRQRKYERIGHTSNVATPGFVVNGEGWNGWFWRRSVPKPEALSGGPLSVAIEDQSYTLDYQVGKHPLNLLNAHVAVLGFGVKTAVPKGENAGKTLAHDFVVVGYQRARLEQVQESWSKRIAKPDIVDVPMSRQALVAWITANDDPKPLQVASGWLN